MRDNFCDLGVDGYENYDLDASTSVYNFFKEGKKCKIHDSDNRREFETGAVRDGQDGKGCCDLLLLDVVGEYLWINGQSRDGRISQIFRYLSEFQTTGNLDFLYRVLSVFSSQFVEDDSDLFIEAAKHIETMCDGTGNYAPSAVVPVYNYINSAVRHYLKFLSGDSYRNYGR